MIKVGLLAIYTALCMFGMYKMKSAEVAGLNFDYMIGVITYGASFFVWMLLLRLLPLSVAYPLTVALLLIGSQLLGTVLDENLSTLHLVGVSLIFLGISLIGYTDLTQASIGSTDN